MVAAELMLIKVNAEGDKRTEVLQIAEIFKAKIVDVERRSLTLRVVGDERQARGAARAAAAARDPRGGAHRHDRHRARARLTGIGGGIACCRRQSGLSCRFSLRRRLSGASLRRGNSAGRADRVVFRRAGRLRPATRSTCRESKRACCCSSDLVASDTLIKGLAPFSTVVALAVLVLFLVWVLQRPQEGAIVAATATEVRSGLAVGSFFIPGAEPRAPFLVMREVWRESDQSVASPAAHAGSPRRSCRCGGARSWRALH